MTTEKAFTISAYDHIRDVGDYPTEHLLQLYAGMEAALKTSSAVQVYGHRHSNWPLALEEELLRRDPSEQMVARVAARRLGI